MVPTLLPLLFYSLLSVFWGKIQLHFATCERNTAMVFRAVREIQYRYVSSALISGGMNDGR